MKDSLKKQTSKEQGKEKKHLGNRLNDTKTQLKSLKMDSNFKFFRSIGAKLFIIFFVSIVLCVSTVGVISYIKAKSLLVTNVSEASVQTIKQVGYSVDTVLKSFSDISFQIVVDDLLADEMKAYVNSTDAYNQIAASRKINDRLTQYTATNYTIKKIALIPMKEGVKTVIAGPSTTSYAEEKTTEQYYSEEWYKQALDKKGAIHWIEPQANGILTTQPYETVALARLVRNLTTNEDSFVVVLELDKAKLFEAVAQVDFGLGSDVYILNNQNQFAFSSKALYGSEPNITISESESTLDHLNQKGADGEEYLVAFQKFSNYEEWTLIGTIPVVHLAEQAAQISGITLIVCIVAIIIAILIGIFVVKNIGGPLARLSKQMEKGAKGDLTVRSEIKKRTDEIGMLAKSFDEMMVQIAALATQTTVSAAEVLKTATLLSDTSNKTAIAAKEIAVATDEIAGGATSLAMETERGTDLTYKIHEQMNQVNQYSQQMSESASKVEEASQQGINYMKELIDKTVSTEQMTRSMVEKVNALQDSTKSIVKILDVLNSITQQTNILSLNATIEAARAGAAGRGFMVVADEIRQLADQSRSSIGVVAQITEKISEEITDTVDVLMKAYPLFQEQIGSVKEANELFLSVQAQMDSFNQNLQLVEESFAEVNKSQEVLRDSISSVSAVAEESSATSEEVASLSTEQLNISEQLVQLSEQLQQVSNSLKDSLTKFKL